MTFEKKLEELLIEAKSQVENTWTADALRNLHEELLGIDGAFISLLEEFEKIEFVENAFQSLVNAKRLLRKMLDDRESELIRLREIADDFDHQLTDLLSRAKVASAAYNSGRVEAINDMLKIRQETAQFVSENYDALHAYGVDHSMSYRPEKNKLVQIRDETEINYNNMWLPSSWELC